MLSEREYGPEIPINPDQAYEFMMLTRGGKPHDLIFGYRKRELTEAETERASRLIEEIVAYTPGINVESLRRIMFENPHAKIDPTTGHGFAIPFEFGILTRPHGGGLGGANDIWKEQRQFMEDHYLVSGTEARFLRTGDIEVERRHPSPSYVLSGSKAA